MLGPNHTFSAFSSHCPAKIWEVDIIFEVLRGVNTGVLHPALRHVCFFPFLASKLTFKVISSLLSCPDL